MGVDGAGSRSHAQAVQRLRLQAELPARAARLLVSELLQIGRAARDALVGGLRLDTLMPVSAHLADPTVIRMDPAVLSGALRDAARAVASMGYDNEAIALHCVACDGLGAMEVLSSSLRQGIEAEAKEHRGRDRTEGVGPSARGMATLTQLAVRLLSESPLSRPDMAAGMGGLHHAGAGAGAEYVGAGAVEARDLAQRRRTLEQLVRMSEAIQSMRGGDIDEGIRQLDPGGDALGLLPSLVRGSDPWEFFSGMEEEGRQVYGVILEEAISAMGLLLRREADARAGDSPKATMLRARLGRISSMSHPQLSQYMGTERLSGLARRAANA